ncbi:hypothetical protein AB4037_23305 [Labrys sp. KB_33_2]|uniref:hypothetical protein n=1 Tax=Labrys sp. KB_33_2 TaxID=3237479 RepID=UPI003F90F5BB
MRDHLKSFKEAVRRSHEQYPSPSDAKGRKFSTPERERLIQEGEDRYQGFVKSVNRMRDREIESALAGPR